MRMIDLGTVQIRSMQSYVNEYNVSGNPSIVGLVPRYALTP